MRFPKPRRTEVHGNVRWLVRTPKAMGGGREFFETKEEADKKLAELRKNGGSVVKEFNTLPRSSQITLLHLLGTFEGDADALVKACELGRGKVPRQMDVKSAVASFNEHHKASASRVCNVRFYLGVLVSRYGTRNVGDIAELELTQLMNEREWGPKTHNDCRQVFGQFWRFCMKAPHRWANENVAKEIPRRKEERGIVPIYEPAELRQILTRLKKKHADLIPGVAICAFTGMRLSEMERLTVEQVREGLRAGHIELEAWQVGKTGVARFVPVLPCLRPWLKYLPKTGSVLPARWCGATKSGRPRLGELRKIITRNTGVTWKPNALRHSYATYRFKVTNDVGQTVDELGTSIAKFERHYRHRITRIPLLTAREWFC